MCVQVPGLPGPDIREQWRLPHPGNTDQDCGEHLYCKCVCESFNTLTSPLVSVVGFNCFDDVGIQSFR